MIAHDHRVAGGGRPLPYSDAANGGTPCTGAPSGWVGIGGTSASAPLMAAIQALVNQLIVRESRTPSCKIHLTDCLPKFLW